MNDGRQGVLGRQIVRAAGDHWPRYKQEALRAEEFAQRLLDDLQRTMTRELERTLREAL